MNSTDKIVNGISENQSDVADIHRKSNQSVGGDIMSDCFEINDLDIDIGADPSLVRSGDEYTKAKESQGSLDLWNAAEDNLEITSSSTAATGAKKRPERYLKIPLSKLKSLGMMTPDTPRSLIAEEYRSIKRPLLSYMRKHGDDVQSNANIVMITSCVEGEGKTFSAINLAMSMAMELDKTVLFVDTDVVKASAGSLLGIADTADGLTNLLTDSSMSVSDVIWQTDISNLSVIPAGHMHDHATELLASNGMRKLVQEFSTYQMNRIVIFDSAPLLMTSEANVLTDHVGQIVFVVAAESTTQQMVTDALSRIQGPANIGLLLNRSQKKSGHGYGYGYGYGYGVGKNDPQRQPMSRVVTNAA